MAKSLPDLHKKVEKQNSSLKKLIERVVPERKKYSGKQTDTKPSASKKINKKIP
jgi:hypothetical protein